MTAEEKAAFAQLQETVGKQSKEIEELKAAHKQPVPKWATDAVDAAVRSRLIDTPDGRSADFYALLTVMYRNGLI